MLIKDSFVYDIVPYTKENERQKIWKNVLSMVIALQLSTWQEPRVIWEEGTSIKELPAS